MDARLDLNRILGLQEGDAHVIRNAGGVVSDDAIRSLVISQRLLGTQVIMLIHHTDCGMLTFCDDDVKDSIEADTGLRPSFALEAFRDLEQDVRQSMSRVQAALLHGPEQIADLPVPVAESPGAVRIGHPERSHLVEYLAPNSVFNSLPRQRSSPHLRPDDRLVTIDRVLHHASLGVA